MTFFYLNAGRYEEIQSNNHCTNRLVFLIDLPYDFFVFNKQIVRKIGGLQYNIYMILYYFFFFFVFILFIDGFW